MIKPLSLPETYNSIAIHRYSYQQENTHCTAKKNLLTPSGNIAAKQSTDDLESRKVHKHSKSKRLD
jgi:hypothetical protein